MPKAFDNCVAAGGKVRTKTLPDGKYVRGCKQGGKKWIWGETKEKKDTLRETHEKAKGI